jgi:hypothetical protein
MRRNILTPAQAFWLQKQDPRELPNYDSVDQNRAGRLLTWLDPWQYQQRNIKANNFIEALKARFEEVQRLVKGNTSNGHLLNGLIAEQQQILQELEAFALKCLKQKTSEENAAKKKK